MSDFFRRVKVFGSKKIQTLRFFKNFSTRMKEQRESLSIAQLKLQSNTGATTGGMRCSTLPPEPGTLCRRTPISFQKPERVLGARRTPRLLDVSTLYLYG